MALSAFANKLFKCNSIMNSDNEINQLLKSINVHVMFIFKFLTKQARLAFAEKGIRYKSRWVALLSGENHSLKYIRNVNSKGTVPAMEHRGVFYTDSKDIIEYVDTLPSESKLVAENKILEKTQVPQTYVTS